MNESKQAAQVVWHPAREWDRQKHGVVLWARANMQPHERPYVGTPNDMLFVRHYTHFSELPDMRGIQ